MNYYRHLSIVLLTALIGTVTASAQPDNLVLAQDEVYWESDDAATPETLEAVVPEKTAGALLERIGKSHTGFGTNKEGRLVYYEAGKPRSDATRRILTPEIVVQLKPGTSSEAIAQAMDAKDLGRLAMPGNYYRFYLNNYAQVLTVPELLKRHPNVLSVRPQLGRLHERRSTPNDPLYAEQWHLDNSEDGVIDINVSSVWDTRTGSGVIIGIVDDGLQLTHPDLAPNLAAGLHYDFRDNDADPSPNLLVVDADDGYPSDEDAHGTSVAGLAAAKGNNSIGVSGVAPNSQIAGLRLIGGYISGATEAAAFLHRSDVIHIKNNSWGPPGFGDIISALDPLSDAALEEAVTTGRSGKGTIFVWSAGNGGRKQDECNKDGYVNSPFTIAVGAVNEMGVQSRYSESGACLIISAPSSDTPHRGLLSTDLLNDDGYNNSSRVSVELSDRDYTQRFGGTSGAAPIVSGVVALMLEANPQLNWRDVQEILMKSAQKIDASDAGWFDNNAPMPLHFNRRYGAGLVDAQAAVTLAQSWTSLGQRKSLTVLPQQTLPAAIPNATGADLELTFSLTGISFRAEYVQLRMTATHDSRGELEVVLVSPSGTESTLLVPSTYDEESDIVYFPLGSVHFWGEEAAGTWTAKIKDSTSGVAGSLIQAQVTIHGVENGTALIPARPSGIVSTPTSDRAAWLTWQDNSGNETGFRIERSTTYDLPWEVVGTVGPNVTYFQDYSDVPSAVGFQYRICAINGSLNSNYSDVIDAYRPQGQNEVFYQATFEPDQGYVAGQTINGQVGWIADNAQSNNISTSSVMHGVQSARVGGMGFNPSFIYDYIFMPEAIYFPNANGVLRFSCQIGIFGPGLDNFGVAFYDLAGNPFLYFDIDAYYTTLAYFNDDGVYNALPGSFPLNGNHRLTIDLDFNNNVWSATLGGNLFVSNARLDTQIDANSGIGALEFYWLIFDGNAPGTNFMLVDDVVLQEIVNTAPTAPSGLEAIPRASGDIILFWEDAIQATTYYVEQRKSGAAAWTPVQDFPVQGWPYYTIISGLAVDTDYEFRVRAHNSNGFSLYSNVAVASTLKYYQDWLIANDLEAETALLSDVFGVGYPLLVAYGLGASAEYFSPTSLPRYEVDEDAGIVTLTYYRARDDVDYSVVRSGAVDGVWTSQGVTQTHSMDGRYVTASYPYTGGSAVFLRLQMDANQ